MREQIDVQMITRLAEAGQDGRLLVVNTTNVDNGDSRVWDVVAEAQRALTTPDIDRMHRTLVQKQKNPAVPPMSQRKGSQGQNVIIFLARETRRRAHSSPVA